MLNWDIGLQFCFLSYFLVGYKLRLWGKTRKNNKIALLLILAGFIINVVLAYINYLRGLKGLPIDVSHLSENPFSYAAIAPIEVIASCLIFAGFSVLNIKKDFSMLAGYTFLIYLFHMGIWEITCRIVGEKLSGNSAVEGIAVVLLSVAVFLMSLLAAVVYKRFQIKYYAKLAKRE